MHSTPLNFNIFAIAILKGVEAFFCYVDPSARIFPGVVLDQRWPDEVMDEVPPDRGTAVVALTHDPKIDDPALEAALQSDAFYIGALGSKKTHGKRVARLTEAGFTEAQIARIQAPIGLDIGAVSPAEIAVAVLAQTTLALRGAKRSKPA